MEEWASGLGGETTRNPSSHHERSSLAVPRQKKKKGEGVGGSRDSNVFRRKWQRPAAAESRRAALQGTDSDCGGLLVEPRRPLSSFGELLRPVRTVRLSFVSGLG